MATKELIKNLLDGFPSIILAIFGGLVMFLHSLKKEKRPYQLAKIIFRFFVEMTTSSFVAIILFLILNDINMSDNIKVSLIGMSGCISSRLLGVLTQYVFNKIDGLAKNI